MIFHDQNRECHAEQSEASRCQSLETLRGVYPRAKRRAQGDKYLPTLNVKNHYRGTPPCGRHAGDRAFASPCYTGSRESMVIVAPTSMPPVVKCITNWTSVPNVATVPTYPGSLTVGVPPDVQTAGSVPALTPIPEAGLQIHLEADSPGWNAGVRRPMLHPSMSQMSQLSQPILRPPMAVDSRACPKCRNCPNIT